MVDWIANYSIDRQRSTVLCAPPAAGCTHELYKGGKRG
ncbi:hypothetical protein GQ600_21596 [Phytophthora cactorum]|nr:hypothetical protein GQ600_21596 [Phytophthora cactorum]